jgi:ribose transport system permease protein
VWATFLVAFLVFGAAKPDAFLTWATGSSIFNTAAVAAVMALAVTMPLIMNDFDLSVGPVASLGNVLVVVLMVNQGMAPWLAIVLTVLAGAGVGLVNGFLVAGLGGNAFIITLGVGSAVVGLGFLLSGQETISAGIPEGFASIGTTQVGHLVLPVFIAAAITVLLWVVTTQAPVGRYFYAVGSNTSAARLVGLRVTALRVGGFVLSGILASVAGIFIAALSASTYPNAGDEFLGSALLASRRFSIVGAGISAVLLQMVATGLVTLNLETWVINVFNGVVLVAAILTARRAASGAT